MTCIMCDGIPARLVVNKLQCCEEQLYCC
jgi:hypothetical protein